MPADPLRERLKALVEEWRYFTGCREEAERLRLDRCSDQLAALLAESEPCTVQECKDLGQCACFREPNPGKTHYQGDDCPGGHESKCGYCGAPCPTCRKCPHGAGMDECPVLDCHNHFDPGALPVLKLGHEFVAALDSLGRSSKSSAYFCGECGQPREAH